jgi:hypothetical protein
MVYTSCTRSLTKCTKPFINSNRVACEANWTFYVNLLQHSPVCGQFVRTFKIIQQVKT